MAAQVPRLNDVLESAGQTYVVVSRRWNDGAQELTLVLREERTLLPLHPQVRRGGSRGTE
jgi:hypothetical protein